jgi:hypothetical protein
MSARGGRPKGLVVQYPLWVCPTCGFAVRSVAWRVHRRACLNRSECRACHGPMPCNTRGCEEREVSRDQISNEWPGKAPRKRALQAEGMRAWRTGKGWGPFRWHIREAKKHPTWEVEADTWPEAYALAVEEKRKKVITTSTSELPADAPVQ